MQFISTRGGMSPIGFTDVLFQGLGPDGGLTVPAETPRLTAEDLESLRPLPYAELAARIIGLYATDIPARCHRWRDSPAVSLPAGGQTPLESIVSGAGL